MELYQNLQKKSLDRKDWKGQWCVLCYTVIGDYIPILFWQSTKLCPENGEVVWLPAATVTEFPYPTLMVWTFFQSLAFVESLNLLILCPKGFWFSNIFPLC